MTNDSQLSGPLNAAYAGRIARLQERLAAQAQPKTKEWWEKYLKHGIPFRGVKMAGIRAQLHAWVDSEALQSELTAEEQKSLALALIRQTYAEDKLAGILYLQEALLPAAVIDWPEDVPRFAALFSQGYIHEWNTCDWFCVKVLGPLAQQQGAACAEAISQWRHAENLWQRRASGVAFVNLAKNGDQNFPGFTGMLLETCAATVSHSERFAQTGTGWVLRELSLAEPERVERFVETHIHHFSREALRTAVAKLPPQVRTRLTELYEQ
jgi:3-methyladenine DNA glycosylase AlkD